MNRILTVLMLLMGSPIRAVAYYYSLLTVISVSYN